MEGEYRMASLSDFIEQMIKEMMAGTNGFIEINRNELAQRINCVPSQITYVLSTRFTNGQGYEVLSRRGGGGSIRIRHVIDLDNSGAYIMHTINSLEEMSSLSQKIADVTIRNCLDYGVVNEDIAKVMRASISDRALNSINQNERDKLRLDIFKNILLQIALNYKDEQ